MLCRTRNASYSNATISKERSTDFIVLSSVNFLPTLHRPFSSSAYQHQLSPLTKEDLSESIPLSLGAICSYWREVAWSTPSLWSSLVIRISNKHDSHMVTGITQEWLARSGQLPLSICIITKRAYLQVLALADIINQYSSRWSNLDLYMPQRY
jgi:hypothetical protein